MILKALCDYYQRDNIIPYGWMITPLSYIIVIGEDGHFVCIEDRRDEKGNGLPFMVPKGEHTNAVTPNLFWDNLMYALDYSSNPTKKTHEKHLAFVERCKSVAKTFHHRSLSAVVAFYENAQLQKVYHDSLWDTIKKKPATNISFLIQGSPDIIVNEDIFEDILKWEDKRLKECSEKGACLITGKHTEIVRIGTKTPIYGSDSSAKLVSFQTSYGFDSYGKEQGANAPIGIESEFAYSTALKHLLRFDSRNKFHIGNRTFVFWASSAVESSRTVEDGIFSLFGFSDNDESASAEQVRKVFKSIYSGELKTPLDDRFYILGLAPNSARIAVSYWADIQLKEFAGLILRHFDDMEIISRNGYDSFYGLYSLMAATTATGNSTDASPNLAEQLVKSIFEGTPYPFGLFVGVLNRIRAGKNHVSPTQAGIIKAYLNRLRNNNNKKLDPMLDKENNNRGYLCGRLFAVLVKMQEEAYKNSTSTVRERYMSSASSTPAAVFSTILNLSSHHAEKLNPGRPVFFEKLKQEIIDKLDADGFPAHLDLQDQGRFFVGYYHQRQDFFQSREETTADEN